MGINNKYQRLFLIFNEEDPGYGISGKPTGHARIEIRNGTGNASVVAQDLREDKKVLTYKLYFIKTDQTRAVPILMGEIKQSGKSGQLSVRFDPNNIGNSGSSFNDIKVIAIGAELENGKKAWPLIAYRQEKVEWKSKSIRYLLDAGKEKRVADTETREPDTETREPDTETRESGTEAIDTDKRSDSVGIKSDFDAISSYRFDVKSIYGINEELVKETENGLQSEIEKEEQEKTENYLQNEKPQLEERPEIKDEDRTKISEHEIQEHPLMDADKDSEDKCLRGPGEKKCDGCFLHDLRTTKRASEIKEGDTNQLRDVFDTYFERHCPFNNRRKDYTWWKVNSPVYLNNILYQFGIKTPLLFNPKALMAHFKYRHLIVGIYQDKKTAKEYIVYGVPGAFRIDERPFGAGCRWVQVEGAQLRYGAFGYWLVYVDPETGRVLGT